MQESFFGYVHGPGAMVHSPSDVVKYGNCPEYSALVCRLPTQLLFNDALQMGASLFEAVWQARALGKDAFCNQIGHAELLSIPHSSGGPIHIAGKVKCSLLLEFAQG